MNRRNILLSAVAVLAWMAPGASRRKIWRGKQENQERIPLVHITDLYHPPQDPDDHIDLATVFALGEYDLKGVILDNTRKFLLASPAGFDIKREPGFVHVGQLSRLLGRPIQVAAGPILPLSRPDDDVRDRPPGEQKGVRLLLDILEESRERVAISVVGSVRVLTAAFNRQPELLRSKIRFVLLNAGSLAGTKREWNVALDPGAYIGLWRSGLPIHWFPCATEQGAFNPDHEGGTYWKTRHAKIFESLAPSLRTWFTDAFSSGTTVTWDRILREERNMWSTASLVMGAGRVLARRPEGWRFVPLQALGGNQVWPWRLDRIDATVNGDANVQWRLVEKGGNALLFGRERGPAFGNAMAEALCALLGSLGRV